MAIKETPTNFRCYYKKMRASITEKYNKLVDEYGTAYVREKKLYQDLIKKIDKYKINHDIDLRSYKEFVENEYIDGTFYDDVKGLFINKKNNYKVIQPLYSLYKLAKMQKELHENHKTRRLYSKMLSLNLKQYARILETFYNEVHKKLIIEGCGYMFEDNIGWLCINRCKVVQGNRKLLDFQATKRNKEKLLAEGKRLWNKTEYEYAKSLGLDYDCVDYRKYVEAEYCYEFALLDTKLKLDDKIRFEPCARRSHIEGRTDEQVIADCDNDLNKICELQIDVKRKLNLCIKTNDLLYLNFIRNESQQSAHTPKANRKSR
jgi:hypothetical protein